MVLEGGTCQNGLESTIIGCKDDIPTLYRLGAISVEEIECIIGPINVNNRKEAAPDAPGMLSKHYTPTTKTFLTDDVPSMISTFEIHRIGLLLFSEVISNPRVRHIEILSRTGDLKEAAAKLYDALHILDAQNLDVIIAERCPAIGLGNSINDRLDRAAHLV